MDEILSGRSARRTGGMIDTAAPTPSSVVMYCYDSVVECTAKKGGNENITRERERKRARLNMRDRQDISRVKSVVNACRTRGCVVNLLESHKHLA